MGDVTIPDNTILHLSEPFTKTWRIRNAGTCTWTTGYKLTFIDGDAMGAPASVPLPINVAPGHTLDVVVPMTAPAKSGHYEGRWLLQAADGKIFGVGETAKGDIWIRIRVIAPAFSTATATAGLPAATLTLTPTETPGPSTGTPAAEASPSATSEPAATPEVAYDFAANPCDAQWQSNTGVLACPGTEGDASGYMLRLDQAQLEDGTTASLPALLTFPQDAPDGYILGVYPAYQVQPGERFQASVGCERDATACSVLFRLSYLDASSAPHDLWTLGEFYDGKYFNLDLDLSQLAGQQVKFILYVSSLGSSVEDRALWVDPRIVRYPVPTPTVTDTPTATLAPPTVTPSPTWTPQPAPATLAPVIPTAVPPSAQAPSIQQILESIISFFQQLLSGR